MKHLLQEIWHNPLLWLLALVPVVFTAEKLLHESHTLLFVLSVLAIVPLAALLSHAAESVAAKTGDAVGGPLNSTLGNLTELIIALAAPRAGEYMVKASVAGAIVTNTLFLLGASCLLGGPKHYVQEHNRVGARMQAGPLFLATIALLIPSAVSQPDSATVAAFTRKLSLGLAKMLESTDTRFDPEALAMLHDTRKFRPKCESELGLRTAKRGIGAGKRFWGCSAYPRCRFTMPAREPVA